MSLLTNCSMNSIKLNCDRKYRVDEFFYQLGKGIWLPLCLVGIWFTHSGYKRYGQLMACAFRRMCGLPCPGCGGTRAFYYFFQGNFIRSFQFNPTVIYGVLAYLHFMLLFFYRKNISGTIHEKEIQIQYYMYAAIVVILFQWAVKIINILFIL